MPMQIVLIRHGIAESASSDVCDFDRALTEKGRRRLKETLPKLIPLVQYPKKILIWSSPLVRARETAKIASGIFRAENIFFHACIGEGNLDKLWKEVQALQASDDCTLIIVGHEPDMGRWAKAMCGKSFSFGKGAAAGIAYVGDRTNANIRLATGPLPAIDQLATTNTTSTTNIRLATGTLQFFYQPEEMLLLSK